MECPICGETLPLSSKVCESCGQEYDGFFLTEEFTASTVRKSAAPAAPRRQPSALKPSRRPPMGRRNIAIIVGAVVLVAVIVVAVLMFLPRGYSAAGKPEEAVTKYYEYLRKGNAEGMFSLFESGFLPMAPDKAAIRAAFASNSYNATVPVVAVVSKTDNAAQVAIQQVEVETAPKSGGASQKQSLAGYVQTLPGGSPQSVSLVKVSNTGSGWKITGRPMGGWGPENIWLLGEVKAP
ncbi:MAG: hypothetical protein ACYC99_12640 [Candidatus Geothermincolia bacterium]